MESKAAYQKRIKTQLSKWKATIEDLKGKVEHTEAAARTRLYAQLDKLHSKRAGAEKLLEQLSATRQDAWEEIKTGMEQGWRELTRTAKQTAARVREAVERPSREEEIREIAYYLWLDEGCPHGRHMDHWFRAESIWLEQQAKQAEKNRSPRASPKRRTTTKTRPGKIATSGEDSPAKRRIDEP